MKKRYIFIIAICAILSFLVSCDGSVDEMLFVHKVTFDYDNGDAAVVKEVKHGEMVDKPEDNPTKSGYVFKCWSLDGTNPFDFDNTAITKSITIKAVWGNLSEAGDIITLGEIDGVGITWKALSVDTGKKRALIVCEDVLDNMKFSNTGKMTYKESDIRKYLTNLGEDGFIKKYGLSTDYMLNKVEDFTDVGLTKLEEDYVFILSIGEVNDYISENMAERIISGCGWWLRTLNTDHTTGSVTIINSDGEYADTALSMSWYLRPAFWYTWAEPTTYEVGDPGPAGGTIFYVNPNAKNDGWTYLEAAPAALTNQYAWGENGSEYNTEDGVGKGKSNTEKLMTGTNKDSFAAAKACYDYSVTVDGIVYDDWFLPSIGELDLMYKEKDKLDSTSVNLDYFWSSTGYGISNDLAKERYFESASAWTGGARSTTHYVWPVRRF